MRILFLANVPSPYRVDFFNELGKYCDLTVLFEKETSTERDESWKQYKFITFKGVILKGKSVSVDSAFCPKVIEYIKDKSFDHIICTTFTDLTGMYAIQYMKRHGIPYYLECDGGFAKNGKGLKEKIKKIFISGAKGYLSTGRYCDEYYIQYGADRTKIIRYPFTSLYSSDIQVTSISHEDKEQLREKLNVSEKYMVLTVGQFINRKGFDVLLRSMKNFPLNIGVYFVGGLPTEEYLELKEKYNLQNAHFVGFKSKAKLAEYYKAADVFVLPTREDIWGLVVQEAMAYGLPAVSTDRCAAALELVSDEKNGYIVPVEDDEALATRIMAIVNDKRRMSRFEINSLEVIRGYTIEQMVKKHLQVLEGENVTQYERK
jgi:glycosyltransferase involved in cell wall biosynthesis